MARCGEGFVRGVAVITRPECLHTMPLIDRREILRHLETSELSSFVERFDLQLQERDDRLALIQHLSETTQVTLGQMLMSLSRKRLKELCRARALDDSGREKMMIVTRLLDVDPTASARPKAVPPIRRRPKKQADS